MRFFFYGTLMDTDVLRMVLGRTLIEDALAPAMLTGHRRVAIRGRPYPMIVGASRSTVDGVLASGLDETDAVRLTWYESDGYDIVAMRPWLADGRRPAAWVFLPRPGTMTPGGGWALAEWQRRYKPGSFASKEISPGAPTSSELADARASWGRRRCTSRLGVLRS